MMNIYEQALTGIFKSLNEWQEHYATMTYKGVEIRILCENIFNDLVDYLVKRWDSTVNWCHKVGQDRNVKTIFMRNLYPDKRAELTSILKAMGTDDVSEIVSLTDENSRKDFYIRYSRALCAKVDQETAEKEKQENEELQDYEAWANENDWVHDIDSLSYVKLKDQLENVRAAARDRYNKNRFFNLLRDQVERMLKNMLAKVPTLNFGALNGWTAETSKRYGDLRARLEAQGYKHENYSREKGRCCTEYTTIWTDAEGNPVYIVKSYVDSSD